MWILLGICSSFFLGFHEIFKKVALIRNAVIPVLFFGTLSGALVFIPFLIRSVVLTNPAGFLYIPPASLEAHLFFLLKSLIVASAWTFSYFSVKHLPVTLLAPINASGPVWTLLGAMLIYQERLNGLQWTGVMICLASYYLLSSSGSGKTDWQFSRKWIWFAFLGILFNSISALLDKFLVQQFDRLAMQAWFSIYTAAIFLFIALALWYPRRTTSTPFAWRWAIPCIGLFLVVADFLYFKALAVDGSLVSILIIIRRASAILVFSAGALYFKETSLKKRLMMLMGIFIGVLFIVLGS